MLLATWKVRVVKNVTKVMKTLAEAAVTQILDKTNVLKDIFISIYFMLVAFSSRVKFSKIVFFSFCVKFQIIEPIVADICDQS